MGGVQSSPLLQCVRTSTYDTSFIQIKYKRFVREEKNSSYRFYKSSRASSGSCEKFNMQIIAKKRKIIVHTNN